MAPPRTTNRQRRKLPPVHVPACVEQHSSPPDMASLLSSLNPKRGGTSGQESHLVVNQLLHDREAEPRSRHQLRALAKLRVANNAGASSAKPSRSETPTSVRVQLAPLQRRASLQREDRDELDNRGDNNARDSIAEATAREVSAMVAQLKPAMPSPIATKRPDEQSKPRPAAVPAMATWQAGSTTLARYRRLVGAVARRNLNAIVSQAARNVASRRDLEHRSASLLQRHALALLVRRRDLRSRERAVTVLQRWVRVCQWLRRVEKQRSAAEMEKLRVIQAANDTAAGTIQRWHASCQADRRRRQAAMELERWREAQVARLRRAYRVLVSNRRSRVERRLVRTAVAVNNAQRSGRLTSDSTHVLPTLCQPEEVDGPDEGLLDLNDGAVGVEADPWPCSSAPVSFDVAVEAGGLATHDLELASDAFVLTPMESIASVDFVVVSEVVGVDSDGVASPLGRSEPTEVMTTTTTLPNTVGTEPEHVDAGRNDCAPACHEDKPSCPTNTVTASTATDRTSSSPIAPSIAATSHSPTESAASSFSAIVDNVPTIETSSCPSEPPTLVDSRTQHSSALTVISRLVVSVVTQRRTRRLAASACMQRAVRGFLARQHEHQALEAELSELRDELARSWAETFAVSVNDAAPATRHIPNQFCAVSSSDGDSDSDGEDSSVDADRWRPAEALECAFLPTRDGLLPPGVHLTASHGPRGTSGDQSDGRGLVALWWWHWPSETWEAAMPARRL